MEADIMTCTAYNTQSNSSEKFNLSDEAHLVKAILTGFTVLCLILSFANVFLIFARHRIRKNDNDNSINEQKQNLVSKPLLFFYLFSIIYLLLEFVYVLSGSIDLINIKHE